MTVTLDELTLDVPLAPEHQWNDNGYLVLPGLLPEELMVAYEAEWEEAHAGPDWARSRRGGWPDPLPYTRHPALLALCCDANLARTLEWLIGEPAGLHLNLTGWVSTERSYHVDSYLNPSYVGDSYAAVWMALDTIHPDSGPFQCVPGSHRWPVVTRDKVAPFVDLTDPAWPTHSEAILQPLYEAEIERRGANVLTYLPERGDVLIWHPRLVHQGSRPTVPGTQRRAVIGHWSGVTHRPDMPAAVRHGDGWVFPLAGACPNPEVW